MGELTFIQKHERVILGVFLLAIALFLINKFLNNASAEADARNRAAQSVLQAQKEANQQTAQQVQAAQAQYETLAAAMNAQNTKLVGQITALSQALTARQKQDATLPLPDLALRQEALLGISSGITADPNGLLVSPSASVQTVQALEQLPVVKEQLADETTVARNTATQLDKANELVGDLNKQVSGLQLQIGDGQKACQAQVAAVKKSRWKWFKAGAVVGFVGGLITGHYIP